MKTTAKITAMLLVLALVGPASARVITVEVEGVVDIVNTQGGFAFDGSVNIGTAMTGYCIYDTDTPDEYPMYEDLGRYSVISISMVVGNYTFAHDATLSDYPLFLVGTGDPNPFYRVKSDAPHFDGIITADGSPRTYDDITWVYTNLQLMNLHTSSNEYIPTDELFHLRFDDLTGSLHRGLFCLGQPV